MMDKPKLAQKIKLGRRRVKTMPAEEMVTQFPLIAGHALPLVLKPNLDRFDLAMWAAAHRDMLHRLLLKHGGLLFRGFNINGPEPFSRFVDKLSDRGTLRYTYASTPRSRVHGNIYTSTEYPADQRIPLHSENAYAASWPACVFFHCMVPAEDGGETPVADCRALYQKMDPALLARFESKQLMYVRNFGELSLPWQEAFGTEDKAEVHAFAKREGIQLEWLGPNRLRARQILPATRQHPQTKEWVWFNQAHLFHVSALPTEVREELLSRMQDIDLPRHVFYGDGSAIEPSVLTEIRQVYAKATLLFPWQVNDILLLDNMLSAHGRMPYRGKRRVLVAMTPSLDPNPDHI